MEIDFGKSGGLVPAIIQDDASGDVLMLGFMNEQSYRETWRTGEVVFSPARATNFGKRGNRAGMC